MTRISVEDLEESTESKVVAEPARVMTLALGEPLSRAEASTLQKRRISRAIGIVAPNDAGKTSLLASLYDLLQEGPVAGVGFAGSSTLIGFEKVCHDARAASRRDVPHMERTSVGAEATFFHLDLRPAGQEIVSLFISDRSGEDYLTATDELARADEFFELRRADIVTLLVNGEHLASSQHRHEVKAITPQIVDALAEAGALRQGSRLAVVLTKQDAVLASPHADRVDREFNGLVDGIAQRHRDYLDAVARFVVAASPADTEQVKRGYGVDELLLFWLRSASPPPSISRASASHGQRMIDLFERRDGTL
ncbi:hypothetical protein [Mesorhizobium sp. M0047]|uniref:TRAFAC clade GTPase domain-containing protein n=1 Tax=Mesorhizobium sp. M0047 TaxID=2956859 RepID=UPI003338D350